MALHLVSEKILSNSDIEPQQNRLLIPIADTCCRLLPFFSLDERRDANLLNLTTKKRKKYDKKSSDADNSDRKRKKTEIGQKHGGLEVRMVTKQESRGIGMMLTRWDGTLAAVLKGGAEWKAFVAKEGFHKDDKVQLFFFRRNVTELCFKLCKKECGGDDIATVVPALEVRQMTNIEQIDLSLSFSLPTYSALQNNRNLVSRSFDVGAIVMLEEKVSEENNLNLELTLRQPEEKVPEENNLNLELTLRQPGPVSHSTCHKDFLAGGYQ